MDQLPHYEDESFTGYQEAEEFQDEGEEYDYEGYGIAGIDDDVRGLPYPVFDMPLGEDIFMPMQRDIQWTPLQAGYQNQLGGYQPDQIGQLMNHIAAIAAVGDMGFPLGPYAGGQGQPHNPQYEMPSGRGYVDHATAFVPTDEYHYHFQPPPRPCPSYTTYHVPYTPAQPIEVPILGMVSYPTAGPSQSAQAYDPDLPLIDPNLVPGPTTWVHCIHTLLPILLPPYLTETIAGHTVIQAVGCINDGARPGAGSGDASTNNLIFESYPCFNLYPCGAMHLPTVMFTPLGTETNKILLTGVRKLGIISYDLAACAEVFRRVVLDKDACVDIQYRMLPDIPWWVQATIDGAGNELRTFSAALADVLLASIGRSFAYESASDLQSRGSHNLHEDDAQDREPENGAYQRDMMQPRAVCIFCGREAGDPDMRVKMNLFPFARSIPGNLTVPVGRSSKYNLLYRACSYSTFLAPILHGLTFTYVTHLNLNLCDVLFDSMNPEMAVRMANWQAVCELMPDVTSLHLQNVSGLFVVRLLRCTRPEDRIVFLRLRELVLENVVWWRSPPWVMAMQRQFAWERERKECQRSKIKVRVRGQGSRPMTVLKVRAGVGALSKGGRIMKHARLMIDSEHKRYHGTAVAFAELCLCGRMCAGRQIEMLKVMGKSRTVLRLKKAHEKMFRDSVLLLEWELPNY